MKTKENNIAVLATDLHISKNNIAESKESLKNIMDSAKELSVPIILLGDIFDSRVSQPLIVLRTFQEFIDECGNNDVKVYAIAGNHDKTDLEDEYSYISVVSGDNYYAYEKETVLHMEDAILCFLPYFPEHGSYIKRLGIISKMLKTITEKLPVYLFTHIGVDQVKNNDGSSVENNIKTDLFKQFKQVFIGHYHNKSVVGDNIIYMGSDRPKNYGEDNDKGIIVLTDNDFHEINTKFKKYLKFDFEIPRQVTKLTKLTEKYSNSPHNVRFNLKGREDHLSVYKKSEFVALGIDLKKTTERLHNSIRDAKREQIINFDKKTIAISFVKFAQEFKMPTRTRQKALKILKDVHSSQYKN